MFDDVEGRPEVVTDHAERLLARYYYYYYYYYYRLRRSSQSELCMRMQSGILRLFGSLGLLLFSIQRPSMPATKPARRNSITFVVRLGDESLSYQEHPARSRWRSLPDNYKHDLKASQ